MAEASQRKKIAPLTILAVLFLIYFLYQHLIVGIRALFFFFLLPLFILSVLEIRFAISPQTKFKQFVRPPLVMIFYYFALLIIFILVVFLFSQLTGQGKLNLPPYSYARCAWLSHIPEDWECRDNWEGSTRFLTASDPNKKDTLIQLQILTSSNKPLPFSCINLIPATLPRIALYAAATIPMHCLGFSSLMYRADFDDSGSFRLISKNVPLGLFLANLDNMTQGNHTSDSDNLTTNHIYKITPLTQKIKFSGSYVFELHNTNFCKEDGSGLNEEVKVRVGERHILATASIKSAQICTLMIELPVDDIVEAKYRVSVEVNGFKQWLEDKVEFIY